MWNKLINVLKAPVFPGDEEKTQRARALNALHLNIGGALLIFGSVGIAFVFVEKQVTSVILLIGMMIIVGGMILNRRGYVKASALIMLAALWAIALLMASLSGGIRSLDIIFFIAGTVAAGILLGDKGAYSFAGLSLLSGLGMIFAERMGVEFPHLFAFPPVSAWIILFINLVFTVVPLQVALQSLSASALRARLSEERYRLIASVMSDYAFSIQYGPNGEITDQWLSGAFEAITGYSSDEYFARGGWLSILHPEDRAQDERDMEQLRANQMVSTEVRILKKDGSVRWVRSYGQPLWDEKNNRLAGIYGAVQDTTNRKQIEFNLRQRADEMALLYQITLALTSEEDLYHALRALVKEIKRVMMVDAFHVGLYDEQTDIFSYSLFLNLGEDLQLPPRKLSESPGLTWEVISGRQTLYLQDIMDPETQGQHNIIIVIDAGIRSYIGIPLMLQERVIGVMSVQSCQTDAYTSEQIRLLETLAGQVAITVEKLNLLERLQQELRERKLLITELELRNAEAETLRESTAIVAAALDIPLTVQRILEQIKRVVLYDSASVWLYEGEKVKMVGWNGLPLEMEALGEYIRSSDTPDYRFWKQQDEAPFILIDDLQDDYPIYRKPPLNYIHGWLGVPLQARGKLIGFIALDSRIPGKFIQHDAELARTFAEQVSVALDDARLFADLQAELKERTKLISELEIKNIESETLRESTAVIASTLEISETVQRLLEQLKRVVQYDAASVWLYRGELAVLVGSYNLPANVNPAGEYVRSTDAPDHLFWQAEENALPYKIFADVGEHYPIFRVSPLEYIRGWLGVPLWARDALIGYIALDSRTVGKFTEHDAEMAVSLAGQVSIALENARLFSDLQSELEERRTLIAELKTKNAEAETLRQSTAIIAATLDVSETVQRILEQLKRIVQYDVASVWLYRDGKAILMGAHNMPPDVSPEGEYILSYDAPDHNFWANEAEALPYFLLDNVGDHYPIFRDPPLDYIKAWLGVSLWANGRLMGYIALDSSQPAKFNKHDAEMTVSFAEQVSIALEKARLFGELQEKYTERQMLIEELELRNAESETLRESAAIVAATLNQSEAIARILEQLERVVHYNSASVQLLTGDMLEIVSSRGLDFNKDDIGIQFPLNASEPSYPIFLGEAPYILYEDVQASIPEFNEIPHDNIHAWMAIPLKVKGQIIGIIALDGQQAGQFTARDANLAVTYANQVAVALENARLFSELQDKFAERQKLIDELENKNAELERFTYTVSHDLRSPLVTIKGFLGYLEKDASVGNMENFRKDMARISGATDRMDNLLKDVLELSRIGRLVNKPKDIPFATLVAEAVEIVHGRLDARKITLQIQPDLPIVHVDKPRLIEVLQNLIDNAAKYMGDHQTHPVIEIGTIESDAPGKQTFFVRDNGMGIAPEYHERIFGLFDKLDVSSEGTGIGLALVKRIIEFHGGSIWVESEVGQGSTFYFTLQR